MTEGWTIPEGADAIYLVFPWNMDVVLCIHRPGARLRWKRTHELVESKVGAAVYAMQQTDNKREMFERMVVSGVIAVAPPPTPAQAFYDVLAAHDWTHSMSDDGKVHQRGLAQEREIQGYLYGHPEWEPLFEAYKSYVWKKTPKPERPA